MLGEREFIIVVLTDTLKTLKLVVKTQYDKGSEDVRQGYYLCLSLVLDKEEICLHRELAESANRFGAKKIKSFKYASAHIKALVDEHCKAQGITLSTSSNAWLNDTSVRTY